MSTRFGIIGLGAIANRFATVLGTVPEATLVAVASRDMARSLAFAEKYQATKAYDNYDTLIQDPEVDIIYVALTHNFHVDLVAKCLANKKAVICEKPLVTTAQDAQMLVGLAHENNTLLMEAMWTRCIPAFQKAKEWVSSGAIGDLKLIDASFCFNIPFMPEHRLFNPELAGGSLYDAGIYPIAFTIGIAGENPTAVKGLSTTCPTGVDDFVAMSLGFENGALATLSCGFSANTCRDAYIYGNQGHIVVYDYLGSPKCERFDTQNNLLETFEERFEDGFIYQIQHMISLFKDNQIESPLVPHNDSIWCAEVFDRLMAQF